jgi:hypothetical protein
MNVLSDMMLGHLVITGNALALLGELWSKCGRIFIAGLPQAQHSVYNKRRKGCATVVLEELAFLSIWPT